MVSVIIPTWNEEASLPETLAALKNDSETEHEVIIVDGGSTDQTIAVAHSWGHQVIESPDRHRAKQMNLGAAEAQGTALWFLHADTEIPQGSLACIESALQNDTCVVGGGFARWFRSTSPFLRLTCLLAQLRSQWFGMYFGDQALYARTSTFRDLGGFEEMPVFEDMDLCQRLKVHGELRLLRPAIRTSARRFDKHGALLITLSDLWLTLRYLTNR